MFTILLCRVLEPNDNHFQLHQEDRSALKTLRLVSRACQRESEFLFFRSIALHDKGGLAKTISSDVMKRLQNDKDVIIEHVRHLRVGPIADEEWFYLLVIPSLVDILKSVKNLHSLIWEAHLSPGPNVLAFFQETHPDAQLQVICRHRRLIPMDRDLLSSSQLHTLNVTVYGNSNFTVYSNSGDAASGHHEFGILKDCLIRGNSIKVLHIAMDSTPQLDPFSSRGLCRFKSWNGVVHGLNNFDWQKGDRFPALEELKFDYINDRHFHFSLGNCFMWVRCMDWSKLQRLELDRGAPRPLFLALTRRVPSLKYLKCGIWIDAIPARSNWDLRPLDTGLLILSNFLDSVPELHGLEFKTFDYGPFMEALSTMLACQKYKLRRLDITCTTLSMEAWTPQQFTDVIAMAPALEYLKAYIKHDILEGVWEGEKRALNPQQKYECAVKRSTLPSESVRKE